MFSALRHTTLVIYFREREPSQGCLLMGRGAAVVCPAQRWAKWQNRLATTLLANVPVVW